MQFYEDTTPWKLNGETVSVVDKNEHLGLIVSGLNEEQKNVDENIQKCRKSLFALLGPAYAFKCLLSPALLVHLWRTYNLPVLLSGLAALPLRPPNIRSLTLFHNKILRGFLRLSSSSPTAGLYFLLGELPIEARVHIDTLTLFHNIWASPETTIHKLIKYILKMSNTNSTTWSNHLNLLCQKYDLPSPLLLMEKEPAWAKSAWKCLVETKVTVYFENQLRRQSTPAMNSKMKFLNVQLNGLSGRPHPAIQNIFTTQDSKKLRLHLKFLTGDFLHAERLALDQKNLSPACKLCSASVESTEHVLVTCSALSEVHQRLYPDLINTVASVQPSCKLLVTHTPAILTQFILDCTSINLDNNFRIPAHNPNVHKIFTLARDWCYAVSNARTKQLTLLAKTKAKPQLTID